MFTILKKKKMENKTRYKSWYCNNKSIAMQFKKYIKNIIGPDYVYFKVYPISKSLVEIDCEINSKYFKRCYKNK